MLDRANATNELVIFLEHFPYVLEPWLTEHPERTSSILNELNCTIAFLRSKGVIHFDTHFHNILTDGEQAYLTDFGLVLDRQFDLSEDEQAFFDRNTVYDYGLTLACLGFLIRIRFDSLGDEEKKSVLASFGLAPETEAANIVDLALENLDKLEPLVLEEDYLTTIKRFRDPIRLMRRFLQDLRDNPRKDTVFPQEQLREALQHLQIVAT